MILILIQKEKDSYTIDRCLFLFINSFNFVQFLRKRDLMFILHLMHLDTKILRKIFIFVQCMQHLMLQLYEFKTCSDLGAF